MGRSKWKAPFSSLNSTELLKRRNKNKYMGRSSKIMPAYLGHVFKIHNGRIFVELLISENMIGHKFGEFVFTRAKYIFKSKKNKKKLSKKFKKKT